MIIVNELLSQIVTGWHVRNASGQFSSCGLGQNVVSSKCRGGFALTELKYKFTYDTLLKMLFVKFPGLLKRLVAAVLGIAVDSISEFMITNPDIPPEAIGDKFCHLDITMAVNGQLVNLEVQVADEGDYPERTLYHWARVYSSALKVGQPYSSLPRVIIISIVDFLMFGCPEYRSEFRPLEVNRHELLSDKLAMLYFEVRKLPKDIDIENELELMLSLFRAKTEEELKQLEALEVPVVQQANLHLSHGCIYFVN